MANVKSGRKKLIKVIIAMVAVLMVSICVEIMTHIDYYDTTTNPSSVVSSKEEATSSASAESSQIDGELIFTMIDVGQADSFLFECDGKFALIDCGTRSTGKDVVEYLNENGITHLDYVFGTHPHDDHMGGMYDVITSVEVGKVIMPEVEPGTIVANWYIKLIDELSKGEYQLEYPKVGDTYYLGETIMKVIGQSENVGGNTNNYSTVMKVTFGEMDVIMTGDAETEVEEEILLSKEDISAEILKVGHHGSDTSTSKEFLDAIDPEYAMISCKVGNKHNHPTKETMEKLEEREIEVYRTDESGTVVATITATDVTFSCEPGDYLSGPELEEREEK